MNRAEKETFVSELVDGIKGAQALALVSFNKITVEQMTSFRLSLSKQQVRAKVVKNTLGKRAFKGTQFEELAQDLKGPSILLYSDGDPVVTAKAIFEWAGKEDFNLEIKKGVALGQLMSNAQLKALSLLPGRNELFVSFLWALKAAPTQFLYALQDSPKKLGYALQALKEKKEKESN